MTAKLKLDGISSKDGQRIVYQHVRGKLIVYPHSGDQIWTDRKARARVFSWDRAETEGTILALNTHKTMGAPSGTWQATIKLAHDSDLDLARGDIMDGDWVDVIFLRNGIEFSVMRGVVEAVQLKKMSAEGVTARTFTLTGKDHGAPFEMPIAWQSFWVQSLGQLFRGIMTDRVKGAIGGSPDEMFEILIDAAFAKGRGGNRSNWQLPDSLAKVSTDDPVEEPYFRQALQVTTEPTRGAYYNEIQAWTQVGQTLHQTLQQWCNPIMNEIYYDLVEGLRRIGNEKARPEMYATLRERPFCNTVEGLEGAWFSLDTLSVPDWLVEDYEVGRDGTQRYNLIELIADFGFVNPQEAAAFAAPIWDRIDIEIHGLRPWQQNVRYVAKDNAQQGLWQNERKLWQKLLTDWYAPNPYFGNGRIGAGILLPEAKIGTRVKYDTDNEKTSERYYLEGVENTYSFSRAGHYGRTKLSVTRGFPGSEKDYLKMVQAATRNYDEVF
ncbi:MAG: hypothetical protein KJN79_09295 [Gammaproteobacteria bacterium]|nr:hypothetical protein [Gammaproteobacteria bacterium]